MIIGGAGNDSIESFGEQVTLSGGKGNDTLTGSRYADVFIYESGKDVITNYSGEDIIQIASGKIDSYSFKGSDLIFHIGKGSLRLNNMINHAITIKDSSGKTSTQLYGTGYTGQEVIKNLVKAWTKSLFSDTAKLDESIRLCSHFKGIQDVINHMVADCKAAGDADTFLKKYCGIILDNDDTGAITGWDAGGLTVKTAENIIPETTKAKKLKNYTNTSFVKNNLKINISEDPDNITDDDKEVLNGLYSWWAEESLKLIEESYNLKFKKGDEISFTSEIKDDGYGTAGATSFDGVKVYVKENAGRTIAHEFTHVAQNFFMGRFPQFLHEGFAELTHGIDDMREWDIRFLTDADLLKIYLDLDNYDTGDASYYAAGYMFYRYLAKQAADNYDSSVIHAWEDNVSIVGTKKAEFLTSNGDNVTIDAGKGNDTLTAYGYKMQIFGGAGNDSIYNAGSNSTISGGDGKDSIDNFGSNVSINGDMGNDCIYNSSGSKNSINGGSGKDSITTWSGSNIKIDGGADDDYITINDSSKLTINGGSGDDYIEIDYYSSKISINGGDGDDIINGTVKSITISGGKGNDWICGSDGKDKLYGDGNNDTLSGGMGNDSLWGGKGDDYLNGDDGNDKLYGGAGNDTLWGYDGNDSLWGDAGADTFFYQQGFGVNGKDIIYGFEDKDTLTFENIEFTSSYKNKVVTFKFDGGSVTLKDFTATTFHVNYDTYQISGSKLVKK